MKYWYRLVIFFKRTILQKKQKISLLEDVSGCSFDTIKTQLGSMRFHVFNPTAQGYRVRFWDDYTEYILSFTFVGKLIKIELEHWKEVGEKFYK